MIDKNNLLQKRIATERQIKLLMKRIIAKKKKYQEKIIELAREVLENARRNEQQYLAQSQQEEKRLCLDGNTSDGTIFGNYEEKV